jgi:hypothetical protein
MGINKIILYGMIIFTFLGCRNNVVLKSVKTNTVRVTKMDLLFELGDTIMFENGKYEIIRKRLRNGDVVKKEPIVRPTVKKEKSTQGLPPPSKKP